MPKNPKQTSKAVAKVASDQLRKAGNTKAAKTTAGSALSQAPYKPKKK